MSPSSLAVLAVLLACALVVRAAVLPIECYDPTTAAVSTERCFEALAKRSHAAAPEKKGYDYIRFGKRSPVAPHQFGERQRTPTYARNMMFKPFLI